MGTSSYSAETTRAFTKSYTNIDRGQIFKNRNIHAEMNPKGLIFREARDSEAHPESVPIIIALDVTGSMGSIPEEFIKGQMATLIETIIGSGIPDPAICFVGIGDHISDNGPLQVGQFESGSNELDKWLKNIWLEGGGGGGARESYLLAYLIGGRHTKLDSIEKRGKKGYLFTIGDEATHISLPEGTLRDLTGSQDSSAVTAETLLAEAREKYEVYHIHVNTTSYRDDNRVIDSWRSLLGQQLIICNNNDKIAEIIANTIRIEMGQDVETVISASSPETAEAINPVFIHRPSSAV